MQDIKSTTKELALFAMDTAQTVLSSVITDTGVCVIRLVATPKEDSQRKVHSVSLPIENGRLGKFRH